MGRGGRSSSPSRVSTDVNLNSFVEITHKNILDISSVFNSNCHFEQSSSSRAPSRSASTSTRSAPPPAPRASPPPPAPVAAPAAAAPGMMASLGATMAQGMRHSFLKFYHRRRSNGNYLTSKRRRHVNCQSNLTFNFSVVDTLSITQNILWPHIFLALFYRKCLQHHRIS